jgi:hypothetical protein
VIEYKGVRTCEQSVQTISFLDAWCGEGWEYRCPKEARRQASDAALMIFGFGHSYTIGSKHQVDQVAAEVSQATAYHLPLGSLLVYPREYVAAVREVWNRIHKEHKSG